MHWAVCKCRMFLHQSVSQHLHLHRHLALALALIIASWVTLVTLVSHSQPLWRGVTQGGVAPVFPFRANP